MENGLLEEHNPKDVPNRTRCFIKKIQANTLRGGLFAIYRANPPRKMEGLEGEEKKGEKVCIFHYGSFLEFARLRKVRVRQCRFSMECCIKRQQNEKTGPS